ncbi:hypothetical protein EVAR_2745_1 [Eumeta japonica]|uniref:Reverse transcriptase domain-containing protein n=1 Tax=Eumeta variegata TaxID=151549 RepID=A0A4C1SZD2_EUMVA|nr:hypothetical protein EVAR_2745_1 [Eumeta japonica]
MNELYIKCLMYADDQIILAPLACGLREVVNKMYDSGQERSMKVNVGKTKVMEFERGGSTTECDILIEGVKVEEVKETAPPAAPATVAPPMTDVRICRGGRWRGRRHISGLRDTP